MRHAQIITYGVEGKLLTQVQSWAERFRSGLRTTRHAEGCLSWLQKAGASLVLLKTGRDLEVELTLLENISTFHPEIATFVLGDADHPPLANLAWDLGAVCVFIPLQSFEHLREAADPWLATP